MKAARELMAAVAGAALCAAQPASAVEAAAGGDGGHIRACIMAAAGLYELPPALLVILLNVEAGEIGKISQNSNKTFDIGPMQVNNTWLKKIASHWRSSEGAAYLALRDNICANLEGGAWILRQAIDEAKGDLWEGVALYHSHTEIHKAAYLRQVLAHTRRLEKQAMAQSPAAADDGGR